jgi:hypothetical protein
MLELTDETQFKMEGAADGTQRAKFWFDYQRIEWK